MRLHHLLSTEPFEKSGDEFSNVEEIYVDEIPADEQTDVNDDFDSLNNLITNIEPTIPNRVGKPISKHKTGGIDTQRYVSDNVSV